MFKILRETHSLITADVCCCLQTYNSNVNFEGMGVVFGQSWMVVPINRCILFCPPIIMYCAGLLLLTHTVNCKRASDGVSTWAKFDVYIYIPRVSCYVQKNVPFIMYYGSALLLFTCKLHCLQTFEHMNCTFGHQSLGVCEVSYTYLLGCLRYREKHAKMYVVVYKHVTQLYVL